MKTESITSVAKNQEKATEIFGVDMGGKLWATAIRNKETGKISYFALTDKDGKSKEERLYELVQSHIVQGYRVVVNYEAGRYGYAPARIMMALKAEVNIIPIGKLRIVTHGKTQKTDKLDAKFLCNLDTDMDIDFPKVYIPTIEEESKKDAGREIDRLKKSIHSANQQMIALFERTPLPHDCKHTSSIGWKQRIAELEKHPGLKDVPRFLLLRLSNMVKELELYEKELEEWNELIEKKEKKQQEKDAQKDNADLCYETQRKLQQFKGIGSDLARFFVWELSNWSRFPNAKKFTSYFGLVPCPYASGTMNREQGISKSGRNALRKKAIELGWLWVRWQKESFLVKKWQDRLNEKGRVRRMAIVALTRQMLVALWRYIIKGEPIEGAVMNNPL